MARDYETPENYGKRLEREAQEATVSKHPWRVARGVLGWDVVAVSADGREVVGVASCHTRNMADFIAGMYNEGYLR